MEEKTDVVIRMIKIAIVLMFSIFFKSEFKKKLLVFSPQQREIFFLEQNKMKIEQFIQTVTVGGMIVSLGEILFGVVIIDNDPCADQTILINLPFWFIFKGCMTLNLMVLLYVYEKNNVVLVWFIWLSIFLHLSWVVVGCDFIWNKCLDMYVEDSIHSALWISIILGMILFMASVKIVLLSNEKKKKEYQSLIY